MQGRGRVSGWVWLALAVAAACSEDGRTRDAGPTADVGSASADAALAADAGDAHVGVSPNSEPTALRCKSYRPERQPFFGDLHVHTALSLDANLQGTRLRPVDSYRFANGERVDLPPYDSSGKATRTLMLERPLDFLAVSDHAEFLGLVTTCITPSLPGYDSETCVGYRNDPNLAFYSLNARIGEPQGSAKYSEPCTADNAYCGSAALSAWNEIKQAALGAQDTTDACRFSSFVAYEWSASPGTKNLHRNVIFRGQRVPALPFGYFDGNQEEQLWDALDRDCTAAAGCEVLTIPHNSNLSAGLMFETVDRNGRPFDRAYAERRRKFEPLVEVFQHKGSSECLPEMGPDEQCSYELGPYNTLASTTLGGSKDTLIARDFVRDALGQGLLLDSALGANPFAYGFVGSTDSHVGTGGGVDERTFSGHGGAGASARDKRPGLVDSVWFNPGGLAVLWAEENSRAALFDAMKRREAYATSGTRIVLRMFAGFDFPRDACSAANFAEQGYQRGVAMGGELHGAAGRAPSFAVWALRDPGTANAPGVPLQRIQIVKGYVANNQVQYVVYDVAGGANDASVDLASCEPRGKGADELCNVWTDPKFDPAQRAFYYARVLENPSCRWHTRACNAAKVDCNVPASITAGYEPCCAGYPATQQERAWSSPIFYGPG
ncbi:MAG: hypothetical protein RLZZ450_5282 [Pseudomonadota bacterium]|jgi:hypothetical protein